MAGKMEGYTYWPNGKHKEEIYFLGKSDTLKYIAFDQQGKMTANGFKIGNRFTGERRTYFPDGSPENLYYENQKGIQGTYLHISEDRRALSIFPFVNDTLEGKVLHVALNKPITIGKDDFMKGQLLKPIDYKILRETNYSHGMLNGKDIRYKKGKPEIIQYWLNGIYLKCDGCSDF